MIYLIYCLSFLSLILSTPLPDNKDNFKVDKLPEVDFEYGDSYSGFLPTSEEGDRKLFFWYFEASDAPSNEIVLWLNGGPGCSSLIGEFGSHGPISFKVGNDKPQLNQHAWSKKANLLFIDQPGYTGLSLGGEVSTIEDAINDLISVLKKFSEVFPETYCFNWHLAGESFAGIWISYLADKFSETEMNLSSVSLGNALIGNPAIHQLIPMSRFLHEETTNKYLKYSEAILDEFSSRDDQCGYSDVSEPQYPGAPIPVPFGVLPGSAYKRDIPDDVTKMFSIFAKCDQSSPSVFLPKFNKGVGNPCLDAYDITIECGQKRTNDEWTNYVNRDDVRHALHIQENKLPISTTPTAGCNATIQNIFDEFSPTPPSYFIFPKLLENNVRLNIYSGRLDMLINHVGTELVIQNMTTNMGPHGHGFVSKPETPFGVGEATDGSTIGIFHQEGSLTYTRFDNGGHAVGDRDPAGFLYFLKKVILNQN